MVQVADPWKLAEDMMFSGAVIEGTITGCNKRGIYVQLPDLKGFMPYAKISPERLRVGHKGDLSYLVGQRVKARIMQVDTAGSRKELILSERQAKMTEAVRQLEVGQVVQGSVLRLEDYGAIVAVESADGKPTKIQGLLHKKEMSWGMVMTVDDVVQTGQRLSLKVISVDAERCRVGLSLKQLQDDPTKATMDKLEWTETDQPLPEVQQILDIMSVTGGIEEIKVMRVAEEPNTVTQDLELYLTKQEEGGGFTLVARCGRMLQELRVTTGMSRDDMKKAITRVLRMVK